MTNVQSNLTGVLVIALMQLGVLRGGEEATSHAQSLRPSSARTAPTDIQDNEHYGFVVVRHRADVRSLTRIVSVADVRGDTAFVFANDRQWRALLEGGYTPVDLPSPGSLDEHVMSMNPGRSSGWDTYPTYAAYLSMMDYYAELFPTICRLDTIGRSVQGRLILVMKISSNVQGHDDRPEILYSSTMHGNETVGYVLLLRLIDYLLMQYGQPTGEGFRVTRLIDNCELWINPLFNPDGTYMAGSDTTVRSARRSNAHGVDLNRDFPDRINDPVNSVAGREPETQAMMQFVAAHNFSLSANFHGGAQVVNYPWDNGMPSGTYSFCPDDAWFVHLSKVYAAPNPDIMSGGFPQGITNGCAWYDIFGGRQDWIYYWYGGRETTIELTNAYNPPGSVLPQRWENNRESFLAYIEESFKGIRGIIVDADSGKPVRAKVDVMEFTDAPVFSDSSVGDYHRLLLPGMYNIVVAAPGFLPDTVRNIAVVDTGATCIDVFLERAAVAVNEGVSSTPSDFQLFQNYPNPFNPNSNIRYQISEFRHVKLAVYDLLGGEVAVLVNERKPAGNYTAQFDASGLASGVYFYRLTAGRYVETRKMLLLQ